MSILHGCDKNRGYMTDTYIPYFNHTHTDRANRLARSERHRQCDILWSEYVIGCYTGLFVCSKCYQVY